MAPVHVVYFLPEIPENGCPLSKELVRAVRIAYLNVPAAECHAVIVIELVRDGTSGFFESHILY